MLKMASFFFFFAHTQISCYSTWEHLIRAIVPQPPNHLCHILGARPGFELKGFLSPKNESD